jgi:hypothetical protein
MQVNIVLLLDIDQPRVSCVNGHDALLAGGRRGISELWRRGLAPGKGMGKAMTRGRAVAIHRKLALGQCAGRGDSKVGCGVL